MLLRHMLADDKEAAVNTAQERHVHDITLVLCAPSRLFTPEEKLPIKVRVMLSRKPARPRPLKVVQRSTTLSKQKNR